MAISCHEHLPHRGTNADWEEDERLLIEAADRLGIHQLCCSILPAERPADVESFRQCNEWVADTVRRRTYRILGYCYVNPGHQAEALREIRRRVEDCGFIGVKLYNEFRCNDPTVFPVVELAIELGVPILQHQGHTHHPNEAQPNISDAAMLAELAGRYPEAILICAHLGGGGDWEWAIKVLRDSPSVYVDTSGSVVDAGIIEMAVAELGADRLLFGCDLSMTAGVGKIRAAAIADDERELITETNMRRVLTARREAAG